MENQSPSSVAVMERPAELLLPAHTETAEPVAESPIDLPAPQWLSEGPASAKDAVVRSYLDTEGKPMVGINELYNEMQSKVASGDESNWNNLVQTIRDVEKFEAKKNGASIGEAAKLFEANARASFQELQANKLAQPAATEKLTLRQRIARKLGRTSVKTSVVTELEAPVEDGTVAEVPMEQAAEAPDEKADKVPKATKEKKTLAYKAGYAVGKHRAKVAAKAARMATTRPIDPLLAKQFDEAQTHDADVTDVTTSVEAVSHPELDESELQMMNNDELRDKYLSMDLSDRNNIDKVVQEMEVRDWFTRLDIDNEADVQRSFKELDEEIATKEAGVQEAFAQLDAEIAEEHQRQADKEAAVQQQLDALSPAAETAPHEAKPAMRGDKGWPMS